MIIPIKQIILESLQNKTKHKVIVYGEAHFHRDEVVKMPPKVVAIVVGDTHLRTRDTPELGPKSKLNRYATELNRSKFSEIR